MAQQQPFKIRIRFRRDELRVEKLIPTSKGTYHVRQVTRIPRGKMKTALQQPEVKKALGWPFTDAE